MPITGIKRKKCCNCKYLFVPGPRNAKRQKYCRKASKVASQRRWPAKPENQGYFSGPENVKRAQLRREANPGYWRGKRENNKDALQDPLNPQPDENNSDNVKFAHDETQKGHIFKPALLYHFHGAANTMYPRMSKNNGKPCFHFEFRVNGSGTINKGWG